jgi:hypothetical protein
MDPIKKALLIIFLLIGISITTLLIVEIILMFLSKQKVNKLDTQFKLLRTIYLKYDLNLQQLTFTYHSRNLNVVKMDIADFEATLMVQKLASWHKFIDNCINDVNNEMPLEILLSKNNNDELGYWYNMRFERKNVKTNTLYFILTRKMDVERDSIIKDIGLPFNNFKARVRLMCDDAYSATGALICINLNSYDNLKKRYSNDIADSYLFNLLSRLNTLASDNTLISSNQNYLWIYRHHLVNKSHFRKLLKKIKKVLVNNVSYEDLVIKVEYVIGYTIIGKFTFSVDIAINQAIQACNSKLNSVFGSSKEYLEFDESMENQNSANYLDFQALKQLISKQEFIPIFNYLLSLYNGIENEYYIEQSINPQHFKDYGEAYACAVKNNLVDTFLETAFKHTLNTLILQKAPASSSFIYLCDINHVSTLIDIYCSNAEFRVYQFMFAIDNFDFISNITMYNEIKDKLLFYKDRGIKIALVVDEKMKMVSHPIFSLFDAFIIPPNLYKDIKKDEKAKLAAIRMIEILPSIANVIIVGVNDKIEVEILMNGDIDYFGGPIIGNTIDINEKADVIAIRKLQSLVKFKENIDVYEE